MSSIDDLIDQLEHYLEEELEPSESGVVMDTTSASRAWLRGRSVLYAVKPDKERQHFYATGLASALLSELYAATGDKSYLIASAELIHFDMVKCSWKGGAKQWPSKCKVAWGTACLLCFGGKELGGTPLTAKALREHSDAVTTFCFLKNQVPSGHFGVYHFPLADTVVEKLPAGMIHWSDEEAQAYGVPKEDYFVGCEEELCAEYVYELAIVSRGLSVRSRL